MAHRLYNSPDTKCFIPHGHNEVVTVTLVAKNNKRLDGRENIVERFSKAKKLWHEWIDNYVDHAFQVAESDPLISFFSFNDLFINFILALYSLIIALYSPNIALI